MSCNLFWARGCHLWWLLRCRGIGQWSDSCVHARSQSCVQTRPEVQVGLHWCNRLQCLWQLALQLTAPSCRPHCAGSVSTGRARDTSRQEVKQPTILCRAAPDAARILPATNVAAHAIAAHAGARLRGGLSAVLGADSNRRRAGSLQNRSGQELQASRRSHSTALLLLVSMCTPMVNRPSCV